MRMTVAAEPPSPFVTQTMVVVVVLGLRMADETNTAMMMVVVME